MKRNLVGIVIGLAAGLAAAASDDQAQPSSPQPSIQQVTKAVLGAANKYASGISCVEIPAQAKDIAVLVPHRNDYSTDGKYAVFWAGDIGCAGGSGTVSFNLAIVRVGAGSNFYVDPAASSPIINLEFPTRGLERIAGKTQNTITVDAAEYGPNDANCCPSVRSRYTLRADEKGNWKLVEKRALPQRK